MKRFVIAILLVSGLQYRISAQSVDTSGYTGNLYRALIKMNYASKNNQPFLFAFRYDISYGKNYLQSIQFIHLQGGLDSLELLKCLRQIIIKPSWFVRLTDKHLKRHYFIQPVVVMPQEEEQDSRNCRKLLDFFEKLVKVSQSSGKCMPVILPVAELYYTSPVY